MIHVGVGHSQSLSTVEAAERATLMAMGNAGIAKADLAIVYLQPSTIKRNMRTCTKRFNRTPIVMNSSDVVG